MRRLIPPLAALALLAGCAAHTPAPLVVAPATDAQRAVLLDRLKPLDGTWEVVPEGEAPPGVIVFAVSSNGSVVREIMFPGTPHEMTNLYHMDGPTLVMTHYCALGNQPRLRAAPAGPNDPIRLTFDSVTNLRARDETYMGQMTLTIIDQDTLREDWRSLAGGTLSEDHAVFNLKRRR